MSKIEVDTIDKQSGSTLTVGGPGTAVTLGSGATQTGFGRTGTVDWCTTAKTSPFTAVSGDGFFVNTSGGAITVTLPSSPSAGDIVAFKDYGGTWATACKAVTLCRNGSKINGGCFNTTLNTKSQSVTLIYVDGTKGWQDIHDSTADVTGTPTFIVATGGTIADSGNFRIHTFTSSGTFCIASAPTPANNNVSYMVVAGGGGGGSAPSSNVGAAAGAGGFREGETPAAPYTGSPLKNCAGLPGSVQAYPITVGAGGAGNAASSPWVGANGANSTFSSITSAGGGGGGSGASPGSPTAAGSDGGSGGGGGGGSPVSSNPGGSGNTPPTNPPQGQDGGGGRPGPGPSYDQASGGGGGAGGAGANSPNGSVGGAGGAHVNSSITGSDTEYAGGAGGTGYPTTRGTPGGGGAGLSQQFNPAAANTNATANTGGGGGGAFGPSAGPGSNGGSGIVVIRYKFQ